MSRWEFECWVAADLTPLEAKPDVLESVLSAGVGAKYLLDQVPRVFDKDKCCHRNMQYFALGSPFASFCSQGRYTATITEHILGACEKQL